MDFSEKTPFPKDPFSRTRNLELSDVITGRIREEQKNTITLRLLNALSSEDRGLKVHFSLATIVFETFELIVCQMLSSQGKNEKRTFKPLSSL